MRGRLRHVTTLLAAAGLVAGCSNSGSTDSSNNSLSGSTISSSDDAATTTTAAISAQSPTTVPDPTIFDPTRLGDLLELSSFLLTLDEFHSNNGEVSTTVTTKGYTNEPRSAFRVSDFGQYDLYKEYLVDGATLQRDHQNYWFIYAKASLAAPDILQDVNYSDAVSGLISATYVGEESFGGIPSYHYTFNETNLYSYDPDRPNIDGEGDFFLAKDGNYLLYAHSRMVVSGEGGFELIDEFTETLSSVDALTEITLPDDMLPLKDALDLGTSLGIPMPADGAVDSMINYNQGGIGVYYYQFTSSWTNESEFIAFYQSLPPTNGWTVTHIGQVKNYDAECLDGNCVIINNADKQVILYFDGVNLHANYDREHQFSPQ
jgi:hypothetical protein